MPAHRKELREKVEERQKLLEQALKDSEAAGEAPERISAIQTELAVAVDATGGGWEEMTETSADRLGKWLAATLALLPELNPIGTTKVSPPPPIDAPAQDAANANNQH